MPGEGTTNMKKANLKKKKKANLSSNHHPKGPQESEVTAIKEGTEEKWC